MYKNRPWNVTDIFFAVLTNVQSEFPTTLKLNSRTLPIAITAFQNRERAQRLTLKNATNATSAARTTNYAHVIGLPLW